MRLFNRQERFMTRFTIFGTGNMGQAIANVVTAGGAAVAHVGSTDKSALISGDVVVLAVPYSALQDIVATYGDQLADKVVVDITNPLDLSTFDSLTLPTRS